MSTRLYPLYQRGNPQLRVFLPNFFMKLVRPSEPQPSNVVTFHCSMEMTKFDVKQYLEKIYKIPVMDIRMEIEEGETKLALPKRYLTKEEDAKVAHVTLANNQKFEFPVLFSEEMSKQQKDAEEGMDTLKQDFQRQTQRQTDRPGIPSWYRL